MWVSHHHHHDDDAAAAAAAQLLLFTQRRNKCSSPLFSWCLAAWGLLRLDGRLGVAVAGEPLDVDLGYGQLVRIVLVVDAARLREPLAQGGLLPQHLGEIRVAVLAVARVQALSKCVHYADL